MRGRNSIIRPPSRFGHFGAWRSLVAHLLWEQDVGSSNLSAPTIAVLLSSARSSTG